jgi:DNA-binding TFAR19-related protein (PDSD5 family)
VEVVALVRKTPSMRICLARLKRLRLELAEQVEQQLLQAVLMATLAILAAILASEIGL